MILERSPEMQALDAKVHDTGTGARPASGSALLAGHVVTVTVPSLTIGDELLAIGDEWTELHVAEDVNEIRSVIEADRNVMTRWL
jgi:hypothetical protein